MGRHYTTPRRQPKRRPAITSQAVRGLPRLVHDGARHLPLKEEDDSPGEAEMRAAQEYLMKLYYWYMERTMNGHYPLCQQHTPGAYIGKNYPSPTGDP